MTSTLRQPEERLEGLGIESRCGGGGEFSAPALGSTHSVSHKIGAGSISRGGGVAGGCRGVGHPLHLEPRLTL